MSARLLAYGGTSFSERRRIGQWPGVPEATLRDGYGLQPDTWSFGYGILGRQPFLILRQRQNVENRGGYPFSLLLDPGEAVWVRFEWNGAALAAAVLRAHPVLLFDTPETCSADGLEALVNDLEFWPPAATQDPVAAALVACVQASEPIVFPGPRPAPEAMAQMLSSLPPCFRAGSGWLAGGGSAHGRALGACLVIDDQARTDPAPYVEQGSRILGAWESVHQFPSVQTRAETPAFAWPGNPPEFLDAVLILHDLLRSNNPSEELLLRADQATELRAEIEQASGDMVIRGQSPLGPRGSALLLELALSGTRKIDAASAARMDPDTVRSVLRRQGSPPKPVPRSLPLSRDLRISLWVDYLGRLQGDVRRNLTDALKQLPDLDAAEREALAAAAIGALPASDERLTEWKSFRADPDMWPLLQPAIRDVALRRFSRREESAARAYLLLGEDPQGVAAGKFLVQPEDMTRLTAAIRALAREYPEEAAEWLRHRPALEDPAQPMVRPLRARPTAPCETPSNLLIEVEKLLFGGEKISPDEEAAALRVRYQDSVTDETRSALDRIVEEQDAASLDRFVRRFGGKYLALGDALFLLSDAAQDVLLEHLAERQANFPVLAARDLSHALNNRDSRNAYTRALARRVMRDPGLRRKVAAELGEMPSYLETQLKKRLLTKVVSQ